MRMGQVKTLSLISRRRTVELRAMQSAQATVIVRLARGARALAAH
jgi:hypothetical protein